jgi:hypothetical protein
MVHRKRSHAEQKLPCNYCKIPYLLWEETTTRWSKYDTSLHLFNLFDIGAHLGAWPPSFALVERFVKHYVVSWENKEQTRNYTHISLTYQIVGLVHDVWKVTKCDKCKQQKYENTLQQAQMDSSEITVAKSIEGYHSFSQQSCSLFITYIV